MQSSKEVASLSVTPSGCPMFQELATRLHILHNALALPLFRQAWKSLAAQFDQVCTLKVKNILLHRLSVTIKTFYMFLVIVSL